MATQIVLAERKDGKIIPKGNQEVEWDPSVLAKKIARSFLIELALKEGRTYEFKD
jgi:hypothetical protein